MDLKDVRHEHFAKLVGETFRAVVGEQDVVELELTEAEKVSGERPDNAHSIVFKGPLDEFLEQRTYDVEHDALGCLSIFLVPIAQKKDGFLYQAVFTRFDEEED
jgi:hypothetical protein